MLFFYADYGIAEWFCRCVYWGNRELIVLTHNWLQLFCCIELIYVFDIFLHLLYYIVLCCQQVIIKKRPSRNINVQNFWLYVFGIIFNSIAIFTQDFDAVIEKYGEGHYSFWRYMIFTRFHIYSNNHLTKEYACRGFFHGYTAVTVCMIVNHALR